MWKLNKPEPAKLIIGILACNQKALAAAIEILDAKFGPIDAQSTTWPFTQTRYYEAETGSEILKKFVSIEKLICPSKLAGIKIKTNKMEAKLAKALNLGLPRPVNLDPGYIEPSKLVLASAKNFAHRIYIGKKIWAEVTLCYNRGRWTSFEYTFPDHRENRYHDFFSETRKKLNEQLKAVLKERDRH